MISSVGMEAHNATISNAVMKTLFAFYAVALTILLTLHIAHSGNLNIPAQMGARVKYIKNC